MKMKTMLILLMVLSGTSLPAREKNSSEVKEVRRHRFWQSKKFWETTALVAGAGTVIALAAQPGTCVPIHGGGVYGLTHPNGGCLKPAE